MSHLTKEAERVVAPLVNALLATTDNINLQKIGAQVNRIMKDVHGTGRTVTFTTVTEKAIESMRYDLSSEGKWLNFNIVYPSKLLEQIKEATPERQERWKHFFTTRINGLCQAGIVKDRPVVLVENLSSVPSYHVQLINGEEGLRVAAIICVYGTSLNTWFQKAEVEVSSCDYSANPSTHFMKNQQEFAVFCQ